MNRSLLWIRCALVGIGLALGALPAAAAQPQPAVAARTPETPLAELKDLFIAVQMAQLFPDSKTFADAIPKSAPAEILARFHAAKPESKDALREFVAANFILPSQASGPPGPAEKVSISRHIDLLWDQLTRSSI